MILIRINDVKMVNRISKTLSSASLWPADMLINEREPFKHSKGNRKFAGRWRFFTTELMINVSHNLEKRVKTFLRRKLNSIPAPIAARAIKKFWE